MHTSSRGARACSLVMALLAVSAAYVPALACTSDAECDDGVACTTDVCESAGDMSGTQECHHHPVDAACEDGNLCTTDTCTAQGCTSGPRDCDDGESCTADSCDPLLGCQHVLDCDDGVDCTDDYCDGAGNMSNEMVCHHDPVDAACDDGDACTTDACTLGDCVNEPIDCDDGDACTIDACAAGSCGSTPVDCDDGDACTIDGCADGVCTCAFDTGCTPQACTPGYWKNNAQKRNANAWPAGFTPGTKIGDVFVVPACIGSTVRNATLLEGLDFRGGRSIRGTAQILLRSAIAGLLGSASSCVQYPVCSDALVARVDAALATCDRAEMRDATANLAILETLGCPLDQRGVCLN